jgi:hypothetical protein
VRAAERARRLVAEHRPDPLPDGIEGELLRVIAAHER